MKRLIFTLLICVMAGNALADPQNVYKGEVLTAYENPTKSKEIG